MKGITAALAATFTIAALAGCSSGTQAIAAPAAKTTAPANPAPISNPSPEQALRTAVQGYVDATLSGDTMGAAAYIDPACDDSGMFLAASMLSKTANGAKAYVDSVYLAGDRGGAATYHLSADASDAFRRAMASAFGGDKKSYPFRLIKGEWYQHPTPCDAPTS